MRRMGLTRPGTNKVGGCLTKLAEGGDTNCEKCVVSGFVNLSTLCVSFLVLVGVGLPRPLPVSVELNFSLFSDGESNSETETRKA